MTLQLTELQLAIQERSDKTIEFWTIVKKNWVFGRVYWISKSNIWIDFGDTSICCWIDSDYKNHWHPMPYWRLYQLYIMYWPLEDSMLWFDIESYWWQWKPKSNKHPVDIYSQNILQRPVDFQEKVKKFLDSLPKDAKQYR